MTLLEINWAAMLVAAPLLFAVPLPLMSHRPLAFHYMVATGVVVLLLSILACTASHPGPVFSVDALSAPFLPVVALLHLLTVLATAKVKQNRYSFFLHDLGASARLAVFAVAPDRPWLLVACLVAGAGIPFIELRLRHAPMRMMALHLGTFAVFLVAGQLLVDSDLTTLGSVLLLSAVLIRAGVFPMHLWVTSLFECASLGTALLFMTPLIGIYAVIRLVLPITPPYLLEIMSGLSLFTAFYGGMMACNTADPRRFFAFFLLSVSSLVLVGFELHTEISMTGAVALWLSSSLGLGGLGIALRAVEARYGRLPLCEHHGCAAQTPGLAAAFLMLGLATIGFPGTLGFIAGELLIDGTVHFSLVIGIGTVIVAALCGIAILRAYFALFTGSARPAVPGFDLTLRERFALALPILFLVAGGIAAKPVMNTISKIVANHIRNPQLNHTSSARGPARGNGETAQAVLSGNESRLISVR